MKNFIEYYLNFRCEKTNIRLITATSISAKTKLIDKDRKGISQNRISDLKNMSYSKLTPSSLMWAISVEMVNTCGVSCCSTSGVASTLASKDM